MIDLRLGDCLDVMKTLPDGCVDAVVTDPPYGQSNESYDHGVPDEVWAECFRVCKSDAAMISFAGSPTYHRIASGIERAGWRVRQMWGWVYRNGFITSAYPSEGFDRLAPAFDPICFATKGKVILPLQREGNTTWKRDRNKEGKPSFSSRDSNHGTDEAKGRWPRALIAEPNIADFDYFVLSPNSPSLRGEKTGHPNQKPLPVMRWLVGKLPRGVILDPYAGSGTTLIAAADEGHDAIGIEGNPKYHAIASDRIAAATPAAAIA